MTESKELKKAQRKAKWKRKKVMSTLDWVDIASVRLNGIILKKGKKEVIIKGIKVSPHDIFLDSPQDQAMRINKLRHVFNKLGFTLYHAFVHNPVNIDEHLERLRIQQEYEEDDRVRSMIADDMEKAREFAFYNRELEFFIMIKGKNDKEFVKNFHDLIHEYRRAGFLVKELNKIDYENYLANIFENNLINDVYFSKGDFAVLFDEAKEEMLNEPS